MLLRLRFLNSFPLILILLSLGACTVEVDITPPSPTPLKLSVVIPTPVATRSITPALTATHLAENIRIATATGRARATVLALTPSRTPAPTRSRPTLTPTIDPIQYLTWVVFKHQDIPITFEYPAYFALRPYSEYPCAPRWSDSQGHLVVRVGDRLYIEGLPINSGQLNLSLYLTQKMTEDEADEDIAIERSTWGFVGNQRSVTVEYRFGALNRYGVETYVIQHETLYTIGFTAGETCELEALYSGIRSFSEFDTYWRILDTLQFSD